MMIVVIPIGSGLVYLIQVCHLVIMKDTFFSNVCVKGTSGMSYTKCNATTGAEIKSMACNSTYAFMSATSNVMFASQLSGGNTTIMTGVSAKTFGMTFSGVAYFASGSSSNIMYDPTINGNSDIAAPSGILFYHKIYYFT